MQNHHEGCCKHTEHQHEGCCKGEGHHHESRHSEHHAGCCKSEEHRHASCHQKHHHEQGADAATVAAEVVVVASASPSLTTKSLPTNRKNCANRA